MSGSFEWDGENPPTEYVDFIGQTIVPGDYVVYSTSSNHTVRATLGKVLSFETATKEGELFISGWGWGNNRVDKYFFKVKIQPLVDANRTRYSARDGSLPRPIVLAQNYSIVKVDATFASMPEE